MASYLAKNACEVYNIGIPVKGGVAMATSESQLKANKKYHAKFERIVIRVSPAEKQEIEAHASKQDESVNVFVQRAIRQTMAQDMK